MKRGSVMGGIMAGAGFDLGWVSGGGPPHGNQPREKTSPANSRHFFSFQLHETNAKRSLFHWMAEMEWMSE